MDFKDFPAKIPQDLIAAIILAAGKSERMGQPKALLKIAGFTFVQHISQLYTEVGIEEQILLIPPDLEEEITKINFEKNILKVIPVQTTEPLETLRAGLEILPQNIKAFFVHPVDFPLVSPATISMMLEKFSEFQFSPQLVKPRFQGHSGHPILINTTLRQRIVSGDSKEGLRGILREVQADKVLYIEVEDAGILADINTGVDYKHWSSILNFKKSISGSL